MLRKQVFAEQLTAGKEYTIEKFRDEKEVMPNMKEVVPNTKGWRTIYYLEQYQTTVLIAV